MKIIEKLKLYFDFTFNVLILFLRNSIPIAFVLLVILLIVLFKLVENGPTESIKYIPRKEVKERITNPTRICNEDYEYKSDYQFATEPLHWDNIPNFKRIELNKYGLITIYPFNTNKIYTDYVNGLSYSPVLRKVIYINVDNANKYSSIIIRDLSSGVEEEIYRMNFEYPEGENSEYVRRITGASFSDDSSKIAITTGESMLWLHLHSGEIETVFTKNRTNRWGVWGLSVPYSWPIDNKLLLREQYYEGNGYAIYDLQNETYSKLEYSLYGNGEKIIDIWANKAIVSKNENGESKLYLLDINTKEEKYLKTFAGAIYNGFVTTDGILYALNVPGIGYNYSCVGQNKDKEVVSALNSIISLNINTLETNTIVTSDDTYSTSGEDTFGIIDIIPNSKDYVNELLLTTSGNNDIGYVLIKMDNPKVIYKIED